MRIKEDIPQKMISLLCHSCRAHLEVEEEDHEMSRIKSLPEVVLAVQKADKEQRDKKNESGPSGSAIPDVDGKSGK